MPMRSPHAAHSKNGSVITHRSTHLGASRESPSLYAGPDAANQGKFTHFLRTTTEAIRQHATSTSRSNLRLRWLPAKPLGVLPDLVHLAVDETGQAQHARHDGVVL